MQEIVCSLLGVISFLPALFHTLPSVVRPHPSGPIPRLPLPAYDSHSPVHRFPSLLTCPFPSSVIWILVIQPTPIPQFPNSIIPKSKILNLIRLHRIIFLSVFSFERIRINSCCLSILILKSHPQITTEIPYLIYHIFGRIRVVFSIHPSNFLDKIFPFCQR